MVDLPCRVHVAPSHARNLPVYSLMCPIHLFFVLLQNHHLHTIVFKSLSFPQHDSNWYLFSLQLYAKYFKIVLIFHLQQTVFTCFYMHYNFRNQLCTRSRESLKTISLLIFYLPSVPCCFTV